MSVPIPQQLNNIRLQLSDVLNVAPLGLHRHSRDTNAIAQRIIALDVAVLSLIDIVEQLIGASE